MGLAEINLLSSVPCLRLPCKEALCPEKQSLALWEVLGRVVTLTT